MLSRRSLLTGLIAAPAVIRVAPLMRIVPLAPIVAMEHALITFKDYDLLMQGIDWEQMKVKYANTLIYGNSHPHIFEPVRFEKLTTVALDG